MKPKSAPPEQNHNAYVSTKRKIAAGSQSEETILSPRELVSLGRKPSFYFTSLNINSISDTEAYCKHPINPTKRKYWKKNPPRSGVLAGFPIRPVPTQILYALSSVLTFRNTCSAGRLYADPSKIWKVQVSSQASCTIKPAYFCISIKTLCSFPSPGKKTLVFWVRDDYIPRCFTTPLKHHAWCKGVKASLQKGNWGPEKST